MRLDKDPALYPVEMESEADASLDLVSFLHGRILEEFLKLPQRLKNMSEFELCAEADPGPTDYKMRQNFTDAVAVARAKGGKIRVTSIYEDVVARQTFFDFYLTNQVRIAFITRPVVPHHSYYDAVFKEGLRKMFLYVRNHDLDPKNMASFLRIVEKAGDRVIGPVAQHINMNQKQLVHHTTDGPADIDVTPENPEQLKAKIKEMQAKLSQVGPIEIEASHDEET